MAVQWYYVLDGQPKGPVTSDELKLFAKSGEIDRDTRVRKGAEGEWVAAEKVCGLFEPLKAEWYFGRDGEKTGPVPFVVLQKLAASGKLSPTDLVWKEGMPGWDVAAKVTGLFPTKAYRTGTLKQRPTESRRMWLWAGGVAFAGLLIGTTAYRLGRGNQATEKPDSAASQTLPSAIDLSQKFEAERVEARQRQERKRAELDRLRNEVEELVEADRSFRSRMAEEKAKIEANIQRLGGPNSELGRSARVFAKSRGDGALEKWKEAAKAQVDAIVKRLDKSLLQDKVKDARFAEEVGGVLAQLKGLDIAYEFPEARKGGTVEQSAASQSKDDSVQNSTSKAKVVDDSGQLAASLLYLQRLSASKVAGGRYVAWKEAGIKEGDQRAKSVQNGEATFMKLGRLVLNGRLDKKNALIVFRRYKEVDLVIKNFLEVVRVAPDRILIDEDFQVKLNKMADEGRYKEMLKITYTARMLCDECKRLVQDEAEYKLFEKYE